MMSHMNDQGASSDDLESLTTSSGGYASPADSDSESEAGELEHLYDQPSKGEFLPHTEKKLVLLTGGAGFIGSAVGRALLERGDDVVIVDEMNSYYDVRVKRRNLDDLVASFGANRCRVYEGDICDVVLMTQIFEVHRPQWICHLAARAGVRPSIEDPFIYLHSNVEGTTRLLELARKYGCRSFTYASSSSVYGGSDKEVFRENDTVDSPVSPYAASKKMCELIAHTYCHLYGINVTGLRFFTVYGPRGRPDMAPYSFVANVASGKEIRQFGNGSSERDYTYITDIVDGVVRAIDRPNGFQIYNLGNGNPVRLSHFISLVEKSVGRKAVIRVLPDQPGDVPRTCAEISKARRELGYSPSVPFEEGIRRTVAWYKAEILGRSTLGQPAEMLGQSTERQPAKILGAASVSASAGDELAAKAKAMALAAAPLAAVASKGTLAVSAGI